VELHTQVGLRTNHRADDLDSKILVNQCRPEADAGAENSANTLVCVISTLFSTCWFSKIRDAGKQGTLYNNDITQLSINLIIPSTQEFLTILPGTLALILLSA
jgi:ABC-type uncharacterized transport system substrate-binding protein